MHYKDGTPAKRGDIVKCVHTHTSGTGDNADSITRTIIGQLVECQAGSTSCNGNVRTAAIVIESDKHGRSVQAGFPHTECVTIGQCEKVA